MHPTAERIDSAKCAPTPCKLLSSDEPLRICFVCTGNTILSPMAAAAMAAAAMNERFAQRGYLALSAGLCPEPGAPIAPNAIAALEHAGIFSRPGNSYREHRAREVSELIIESSDRVIGLSDSHTFALITAYPRFASRIFSMPRSIPDPFGGSVEDYIRCLNEIIAGLEELFEFEK